MAGVDDTSDITRLLGEIAEGKTSARDSLIDAVYEELRKIARVRMAAERPGHTLQATELVHQAYLRLAPLWIGRERSLKTTHTLPRLSEFPVFHVCEG